MVMPDKYGQGTFNTVGYWDIFSSEYSTTNGAWQWSRQIGGHLNNYGYGIAASPTGDIYTAGSFDKDMILPMDSKFIGYNANVPAYSNNTVYCSDSAYGTFKSFNTAGNLDVFISKPFDLNRQTYDYYTRTGAICNRPYEGVCITKNYYNDTCFDTIRVCPNNPIMVNTHTYFPWPYTNGPTFTFLWSTHQNGDEIYPISTGWYSVTQTSADGCFVSTDSSYVIIEPLPPKPTISDNVVINNNAINPLSIHLCRDSITLTAGNYLPNSYHWNYITNGIEYTPYYKDSHDSLTLYAPDSGNYYFYITNSFGCVNYNNIVVSLDSALQPIIPKLKCINCSNDTIPVCKGNYFYILPYDSISNPAGNDINVFHLY